MFEGWKRCVSSGESEWKRSNKVRVIIEPGLVQCFIETQADTQGSGDVRACTRLQGERAAELCKVIVPVQVRDNNPARRDIFRGIDKAICIP
jgi:hypothetical protein